MQVCQALLGISEAELHHRRSQAELGNEECVYVFMRRGTSWLHDCGKVTIPENVVDKATKLECIYNRIHEIRMRFEVLWRDAQIEHYRTLTAGARASYTSLSALDARLRELQDDYAFVAECNEGGEFMAPEHIEQLKRIAAQAWQRHFDDRVGLSHDELERKARTHAVPLPAKIDEMNVAQYLGTAS